MRKILFVVFSVVLILSMTVVCFALPEGQLQPTLFSRLWEFICRYRESILTVAGDVLTIIAAATAFWFSKKRIRSLRNNVATIMSGTTEVSDQQTAVVSAINGLIDGYNALGQKYEQYGRFEGARDKYAIAAVTQSTAILEILYTVYANSKNVPQGVKDLVNLKYANCLKQIGDDKELTEIVESVRNVIGISSVAEKENKPK